MTRAQFLNDLYRRLAGNGMDKDQAEQHLTYYAEMLADRMEEGMSEDAAVASMEDVDTIARRILEEEGKTYRPPEELVTPPAYPDASKLGGGGGTRAYQAPKKWNGRKLAQAALWALAILAALGAVGRWLFVRGGRNTSVDYAASTPVEEVAAPDAPYAEWYDAWDIPYEYGYEYSSGTESIDSGVIDQIDIQWAAGTVLVQSWSGDEIQLQEYARSELNERTAYYCEAGDGTLTIRYRNGASLGNVKGDKWLTVLVPDGILEELDIETTSASVQLNGLEQEELDVSTASGYITLSECYLWKAELKTISGEIILSSLYADELDVSTTSGDVSGNVYCTDVEAETISGDIALDTLDNTEKIKMNTTSGDIWCNMSNTAIQSIDIATTSGDVSLGIPFDVGFTLEHSTVSGAFTNNSFDMVMRDGKSLYNGGGCEIKVATVSGDLELY